MNEAKQGHVIDGTEERTRDDASQFPKTLFAKALELRSQHKARNLGPSGAPVTAAKVRDRKARELAGEYACFDSLGDLEDGKKQVGYGETPRVDWEARDSFARLRA